MYNQQGQPARVGQAQVPRVPPLRVQPNYQLIPRGQFRGQFRGQNSQQMMSPSPNRQYIKPQGVSTIFSTSGSSFFTFEKVGSSPTCIMNL